MGCVLSCVLFVGATCKAWWVSYAQGKIWIAMP